MTNPGLYSLGCENRSHNHFSQHKSYKRRLGSNFRSYNNSDLLTINPMHCCMDESASVFG